MTKEQLRNLEKWIESIIIDKATNLIDDAVYRIDCFQCVLESFNLTEKE